MKTTTIDSYKMDQQTAEYVAHRIRRYLERTAKNELIACVELRKTSKSKPARTRARWVVRIRALLKCAEGEEVRTLRTLLASVGGGR